MTQTTSARAQARTALRLVPRAPTGKRSGALVSVPQTELLRDLYKQLRRAAIGVPQPGSSAAGTTASDSLRATLLDCADALQAFENALASDLAQRRRLESQIRSTQAELRQTREELAGTRVEERDARHLALHDSLTALPNRRYFAQRLAQALGDAAPRREPLAVLFLDLDDFKPVNDTHGHAIGDELLRIIASRLGRTLRTADMVSRLGGDEFACLLEGMTDRAQLSHLACKVIDAVGAPCRVGALQLQVRPSIGIALFPDDGCDAEALLHNADAAMYNAKRHQSGYAFFAEALAGWTRDRH